jgi:hypothetical protein
VRDAEGVVEVGRFRILAADVVDFLVVVRVGGDVDFIGCDPDYWAVLIM